MEPVSLVINKVIDEALNNLILFLKRKNITLTIKESFVRESIINHINYINNWSREIKFKDLNKPKSIFENYIHLDYYLSVSKNSPIQEPHDRIKLNNILNDTNEHIVVLGQPGAGKTTTMKFFCQSIFHEVGFLPQFKFPVLVRLRNLSEDKFSKSSESLFEHLFKILGLKINPGDPITADYSYSNIKECVIKLIDEFNVLIILDGFDEINPLNKKLSILKEIEDLVLNLNSSRLILTSRTGDFSYSLNNTVEYEISPLTDAQILEFAHKWIGAVDKANDLYEKITLSPYLDTAIRPLTLAHLCVLYERFGTIPDKPKDIYKKIVYLLVEEWDSQRMVNRTPKFESFTTDRKTEFLSILSYELTINIQKSIFSKTELATVYRKICGDFSLPLDALMDIINELEAQTGLFIQSGFDSFEFAHKSIQEYLAAEFIVRLPYTPSEKRILNLLPNELAIATSLSTDPSIYISGLVLNGFKNINITSLITFMDRLLLENPNFRSTPIFGASFLYIRHIMTAYLPEADRFLDRFFYKHYSLQESILLLKEFYSYGKPNYGDEMKLNLRPSFLPDSFYIQPPQTIQLKRAYMTYLKISSWP